MPPWWAILLIALNLLVLVFALAFNFWTRDVLVALGAIQKKVDDLIGR